MWLSVHLVEGVLADDEAVGAGGSDRVLHELVVDLEGLLAEVVLLLMPGRVGWGMVWGVVWWVGVG